MLLVKIFFKVLAFITFRMQQQPKFWMILNSLKFLKEDHLRNVPLKLFWIWFISKGGEIACWKMWTDRWWRSLITLAHPALCEKMQKWVKSGWRGSNLPCLYIIEYTFFINSLPGPYAFKQMTLKHDIIGKIVESSKMN